MFRMVALSLAALVASSAACGPAQAQQADVFASGGQEKGTDCSGIQRAADDQASIEYASRLKACGSDASCRQAAMDTYEQRRFENLHDTGICEIGNKKILLEAQVSELCARAKGEADLDAEIAKTQAEKACDRRDGVCNMAPMKPFEDQRRANLTAYSTCLKRVGAPPAGPYLGRTPPTGEIPRHGPCAYPRNSVTCQVPESRISQLRTWELEHPDADLGQFKPSSEVRTYKWAKDTKNKDKPGWNTDLEGDSRAYLFSDGRVYEFEKVDSGDELQTSKPPLIDRRKINTTQIQVLGTYQGSGRERFVPGLRIN